MDKMAGIQYLQIEFRNTAQSGDRYAVMPTFPIPFDTTIVQSKDDNNVPHITFANGEITFSNSGIYFINWFAAQQTGLATDGANFALETLIAEIPIRIIGSGHSKFSASSGFAVLNISTAGTVLKLINNADRKATLSEHTQVKAGLAIFSVTPEPEDLIPLGYAHAQSEVTADYETNDVILFPNGIKFDPDDIITYNQGTFTLANTGTYLVTWEVPIEATDEHDEAYIELVHNGATHSVSYAPLPIGLMSGSALVLNDEADGTLQLKIIYDDGSGSAEDIVRIGIKANIVITQISNIESLA